MYDKMVRALAPFAAMGAELVAENAGNVDVARRQRRQFTFGSSVMVEAYLAVQDELEAAVEEVAPTESHEEQETALGPPRGSRRQRRGAGDGKAPADAAGPPGAAEGLEE